MFANLAISASLVLAFDQVTKAWSASRLGAPPIVLGPHLELRSVAHPCASSRTTRGRLILLLYWLAALLAIVIVSRPGFFFQRPIAQVALGTAIGGAAGNLTDHLRWGSVIDFVKITPWPTFNLADVAISIGVFVALWFLV